MPIEYFRPGRPQVDPRIVQAIEELIRASGLDADHWMVRLITFHLRRGRVRECERWLHQLKRLASDRLASGAAPFSLLSAASEGISLGTTTDLVATGEDLRCLPSTFARHVGVFGLTGVGKTWWMMHVAQQLMAQGITVWIFDRSRDFRRIVSSYGLHPLLYLRPEWLRWNLLQPPGGISAWKSNMVELLSSVFYGRGGSSVVLSATADKLYERLGCREGGTRWPTLDEWWLQLSLNQPNFRSREGAYYESAQRVLRAVSDGFPGAFNRKASVPLEEFAQTSFVMDVADLSVLEYLFLLMLLLEQTSSGRYAQSLQRVVFIDEASEIYNEQQIRRQDQGYPPQHDLPRRYRGRGIGLALADQTPSLLPRDVQSNLGTVVAFRLMNTACVKAVTASSGMSEEQAALLAGLPAQHAIVHSVDLGKPYLVRMPVLDFPAPPSREELEARKREFVPAWMLEDDHHAVTSGRDGGTEKGNDRPPQAPTSAAASRELTGEPASPASKDDRQASPQGESLTKDILSADDNRFLERIARFPQETIDERCKAERLDRMDEWRIRARLTKLGFLTLAGKIGKVEFWGATEKGVQLLERRGIARGQWKSGLLHEVIVRRVEEDLQRRLPDLKARRGGQFDGVQPDLIVTGSAGGCLAVQVSVTTSSRQEVEHALRLAGVDAFSRVLILVTSQRKLLEVQKALARHGEEGLFMAGKPVEKVEVRHASDVLSRKVDWHLLCEVCLRMVELDDVKTSTTKNLDEDAPGGEVEHNEPEGADEGRKGSDSPGGLDAARKAEEQGEAAGRPGFGPGRLETRQDGLGETEGPGGTEGAERGPDGLGGVEGGIGKGWDETNEDLTVRTAEPGQPEGLRGTAGQVREPEPEERAEAEAGARKQRQASGGEPADRRTKPEAEGGSGRFEGASGSETRTTVEGPSEERARDGQGQGEGHERAKASERETDRVAEKETKTEQENGTETEKEVSSVEEGQGARRAGAIVSGNDLPPEAGNTPRQRRGMNPRAARDVDDAAQRGEENAGQGGKGGVEEVGDADRAVKGLRGGTNGNDYGRTTVVEEGSSTKGEEKKKECRSLNLKFEGSKREPCSGTGIDLAQEQVISLRDAVDLLPRRGGKKLHISTLYRWVQAGVRGKRLETIQIGGMQCTSVEALQRFCTKLSEPVQNRRPLKVQRRARNERTQDILSKAGLLPAKPESQAAACSESKLRAKITARKSDRGHV